MADTQTIASQSERIIERIAAACGCRILWRPARLAHRSFLSLDLVCHNSPFCLAQKEAAGNHAQCRHDCDIYEDYWRERDSEPLIRTCHAGLRECITPILRNGRYIGCFFIGPDTGQHLDAHAVTMIDDQQLRAVAELLIEIADTIPALQMAETLHTGHPAIDTALQCLAEDPKPAALRAADLAAQTGLSASRFVHVFKQQVGMSFSIARQRAVMERARRLLAESSLNIGAIATDCGFANQHYFAAAFKREMGCTPSAFRKRCTANNQP